jgi:hypothetical protein
VLLDWGNDTAVPSQEPTPSFEPVAWKVLDQIGEQHRSATMMEESDLGERKAPAEGDLFNVGRPFRLGTLAEFSIENKVATLALQPRGSKELRRRLGGLPLSEKQVMQRIRRNKIVHRPKSVDGRAKRVR